MDLREFQDIAIATDQFPMDDPNTRVIPLLGMAGEVGSLLEEYKKWLRDGEAHQLAAEHLEDELGDILWYLANTASKFELDLNVIAEKNIKKTRDRWPPAAPSHRMSSSTMVSKPLSNSPGDSRRPSPTPSTRGATT